MFVGAGRLNLRKVFLTLSSLVLAAQTVQAEGRASLDDLLRRVTSNPAFQISESKVDEASFQLSAAKWGRFPSFSYGLKNRREGTRETTLTLEQPVWSGGAIVSAIEAANLDLVSSKAGARQTKQNVIRDIGTNYIALRRVSETLQQVNDNIAELAKLDYTINRRVEGGVSPRSDRVTVQARMSQAKAEAQQLIGETKRLRENIEALTGVRVEGVHKLACVLPTSLSQESLLEAAFLESPELARLRAKRDANRALVSRARAELLPRLVVGVEHIDEDDTSFPREDTTTYFAVRYTLGDGLSSLAKMRVARQEAQTRALEITQAERNLREEIATLWVGFQTTNSRIPPLETLVESNLRLIQSYLAQYKVGRRTWLDVVNAQREYNQSSIGLIEAQNARCDAAFLLGVLSDKVFVSEVAS